MSDSGTPDPQPDPSDVPATPDSPDLGPLPTPTVEEPELHPGGPDAVQQPDPEPVVPELPPEHNPAVEDAPAETRESDDTGTEATRSPDGEASSDGADESPA